MNDSRGSLHVIVGAGPLGLAVLRELASREARVRVVTKSGRRRSEFADSADWFAGDAADAASLKSAFDGTGVVYHCAGGAYDKWSELLPAYMTGITEAASTAGARLVYGDNVYAYGAVRGPIHEGLPENATTRKGQVRAHVARMLRAAHEQGRVRAVIGRGSDFYGPHVIASAVGEEVFGQLLTNQPANVLGDPDTRHSQTFILDFGRALVELGQADGALGKTWLVPNPPAITAREFVSRICAQLGRQPRLRSAGRTLLALMGLFDARLRELKEMMYEFEHDFVIDDSAYRRTFGDHDTAVDDAISQTVAWYGEYYTG